MTSGFRRQNGGGGLGLRLMAIMGVALLPLALLTYVQTVHTDRVAESRSRAAILGETLVAASPQIEAIVGARAAVASLAAALPVLLDEVGACTDVVQRIVAQSGGLYSFAAFVPVSGEIHCNSTGETVNVTRSDRFLEFAAKPSPFLNVNERGPISKTSIISFLHPVHTAGGVFVGFASLSVPHSAITQRIQDLAGPQEQPLALLTFDAEGRLLAASTALDDARARLPRDANLIELAKGGEQSFIAQTPAGQRRAFAVVPLAPGTLYLLGSWPANRLDDTLMGDDLPAITFPLLMWAASLLVALLAAESQVIGHVRSLRDSITAFAGGDRKVRPLRFAGAAVEFRDLAEAYDKMTEAVLHDEADLENTIHQKEVLLREVHHRVKNNLQLIASILNMQLRSALSAETKEAMRNVQDRVISLATIHRELYQTTGLADVRADELLPQIVEHILRMGSAPGRRFEMSTEIDEIRLTPDQAVPLSLFLTEGMANALKHGWSGGEGVSVLRLTLKREGEDAVLTLSNRIPRIMGAGQRTDLPFDGPEAGTDGFGSQLLSAFARQLDGRMTRGRIGTDYELSLSFPVRPLTDAEERAAAPITTA